MALSETRGTRIELRTHRKRAERIRFAAKLNHQSVSAFMLDAASARAEEVIASANSTEVPAKYFDTLWAALSAPARPNAALARRARSKRRVVQR
jgi:uncharacterized protein (DUF1778 family)